MKFIISDYYGTYHLGPTFWTERYGPTGFGISLGKWLIGVEWQR